VKSTQKDKRSEPTSKHSRDAAYKEVYQRTRDHRAAVRAYAQGNVWATENAKATGNW